MTKSLVLLVASVRLPNVFWGTSSRVPSCQVGETKRNQPCAVIWFSSRGAAGVADAKAAWCSILLLPASSCFRLQVRWPKGCEAAAELGYTDDLGNLV